MATVNSCGDCKECCTVLHIRQLDKPANVPCCLLGDKGCSTYKDRPQVCRSFHCTWLLSGWKENYRPDKLKMMFMHNGETLIGYETEKGGFKKEEVLNLVNLLIAKTPVSIQLYPEH